MFRGLQDILGENYDAQYKAKADTVVGMGVGKDYATGEFKFPSSDTANDIYFVTKDMQPTGIQTVYGEVSEYELQNIKAGEYALLVSGKKGERFFTDQFESGIAVGNRVIVGTDGKFKAASSEKSNMICANANAKDAGSHSGIIIEIVDWN